MTCETCANWGDEIAGTPRGKRKERFLKLVRATEPGVIGQVGYVFQKQRYAVCSAGCVGDHKEEHPFTTEANDGDGCEFRVAKPLAALPPTASR